MVCWRTEGRWTLFDSTILVLLLLLLVLQSHRPRLPLRRPSLLHCPCSIYIQTATTTTQSSEWKENWIFRRFHIKSKFNTIRIKLSSFIYRFKDCTVQCGSRDHDHRRSIHTHLMCSTMYSTTCPSAPPSIDRRHPPDACIVTINIITNWR